MAALRSLYGNSTEKKRDSIIPIDSFRDLSNNDMSLLASILSHQPPPTLPQSASQHNAYIRLTKADIEKLPAYLRSKPGRVERFVNRNIKQDVRAELRELCTTHEKLNRPLIRSILRWLRREIDVNIPGVLYALAKENLLSADARLKFRQMREVSGMWMHPDDYYKLFRQEVTPRWARQEDACSACILARIGGDQHILTALKAGLLANTSSQAVATSKRHAYIDFLISNGFDNQKAQDIRLQAQSIGNIIKIAARALQQQRRSHEKASLPSRSSYSAPTNGSEDGPSRVPGDRSTPKTDEHFSPQKPGPRVVLESPDLPKSDKETTNEDECDDVYSTIEDLINEYRKTVFFPRHNSFDSTTSNQSSVADSTYIENQSQGRPRPSVARSSSVYTPRISGSESDIPSPLYYAPPGRTARDRSDSYQRILDVDKFLQDNEDR